MAAATRSEIVLIGPVGVGKTTVGRLLAERLRLPQVSMDDHRLRYYAEIGYDAERAMQIWEEHGFEALARHWKPYEAHAVERLLADYLNCVFDFGAGHSVYDDETLFTRVQRALAPFQHVILLLPSPDLAASTRLLSERMQGLVPVGYHAGYYVRHPANHQLATATVYTQGKTPVETADEILQFISSQ